MNDCRGTIEDTTYLVFSARNVIESVELRDAVQYYESILVDVTMSPEHCVSWKDPGTACLSM